MTKYKNELTEEMEALIAYNLNLYLFQNVWNEPNRASRNNILPRRYSKRSITGSITYYGNHIELPNTKDPFYIFVLYRDTVPGLMWPKNVDYEWIATDKLVTDYNILVDCYHVNGKMLHKGHVYVRHIENGTGYLVAVNKNMYNRILSIDDLDGIRFTIYYDYDIANDISVYSYNVPAIDGSYTKRAEIWEKYTECLNAQVTDRTPAVLMFINGIETVPVSAESIPLESYVDIHIDKNVGLILDIDLTNPEVNRQFFSEPDSCLKQIVHIPRKANPDQYIMTHNAIEIYIRKKQKNERGCATGLYMHRCAERSVTQITHQDIGIPTYILDAYKDYLETQEIALHLYWRHHAGANKLVRDKDYIYLLYQDQHTDKDIVDYLSGTHKYAKDIYFWTATHLEKSEFVKAFFDVPDTVSPANITKYIDALGYYNVMFLLTMHVYSTIITDAYSGGYIFPKPLVYQNSPVTALVYKNGVKISGENVYIKNLNDTHVVIGIDKSLVQLGDRISLEMHRDGIKDVYAITPSPDNNTITIRNTEYDLLEMVSSNSAIECYDHIERRGGVQLLTQYAGNIVERITPDGNLQIVFGPSTYDKTYYIQPKPRAYRWSSENPNDNMDIQTKLQNGDPLYFSLDRIVNQKSIDNELVDSRDGERILVWDTDNVIVYLNGRYLVRDIDFSVIEVKDRNDNTCMKILAIRNISYIKSSEKNILEVYCTSATDEYREYGHCAPRYAEVPDENDTDLSDNEKVMAAVLRDNKTVIYDDRASIIHVNGYYTEADISGNFITMDADWKHNPWDVANPIEIRTSIPYFVSDYISRYHEDDDLPRLDILNKYYYRHDLKKTDIEVITKSHLLYSTYLVAIIRDIISKNNPFGVAYDPDSERLWQQLKDYKYMKETDPAIQGTLDLTYIDVYPHYKQVSVPDSNTYRLLQAIIRTCLPKDAVTNKQDVDTTNP